MGAIVGIIVFVLFMSLVGNPHFVETIIGLVLAIASGNYVHQKFNRISNNQDLY